MRNPEKFIEAAISADLESTSPENLLILYKNANAACNQLEEENKPEEAAAARKALRPLRIKLQELGLIPGLSANPS